MHSLANVYIFAFLSILFPIYFQAISFARRYFTYKNCLVRSTDLEHSAALAMLSRYFSLFPFYLVFYTAGLFPTVVFVELLLSCNKIFYNIVTLILDLEKIMKEIFFSTHISNHKIAYMERELENI